MTADTRNTEFKVPHSTNKGYPYDGVASKLQFPSRCIIKEDEIILLDESIDGNEAAVFHFTPSSEGTIRVFQEIEDFNQALTLAEGQITDLLTDNPFVPEDFGFVLVHKNSVSEPPARIYASKYYDTDEKRIFLFRESAPDNVDNWNPEVWVLQTHDNGNIYDEKVRLNCHRIAYAFFYAKMIKVED